MIKKNDFVKVRYYSHELLCDFCFLCSIDTKAIEMDA